MPVIIQEEKRVSACKEIETLLNKIESINKTIDLLKEGSRAILEVETNKKPYRLTLDMDKATDDICEILDEARTRMAKNIDALTKKHRISLSETEEALLSFRSF